MDGNAKNDRLQTSGEAIRHAGIWFDRVLHLVAGALVVVLLGTVTAGIVSRGVNHPFSWTDELSGFLMVWLACAGWMIATRRGAHIRIRYFQDLLPDTGRRGFEFLIQLCTAFLGALVAWKSVHLMQTNSDVEAVSLPIATAWMYVPLLPAGLLTVVQAGVDARAVLQGRDAPRSVPGHTAEPTP